MQVFFEVAELEEHPVRRGGVVCDKRREELWAEHAKSVEVLRRSGWDDRATTGPAGSVLSPASPDIKSGNELRFSCQAVFRVLGWPTVDQRRLEIIRRTCNPTNNGLLGLEDDGFMLCCGMNHLATKNHVKTTSIKRSRMRVTREYLHTLREDLKTRCEGGWHAQVPRS
jgi:hypothetical protein